MGNSAQIPRCGSVTVGSGNSAKTLNVTVTAASTAGNLDVNALVQDGRAAVEAAAATAGLAEANIPQVLHRNGHLAFARAAGNTLALKSVFATEAGAAALGFAVEQTLGSNNNAYPLDSIGNLKEVTGGSMHVTSDGDVYRFDVDAETLAFGDGSIVVNNISTASQLIVELFENYGTGQDGLGTLIDSKTVVGQFSIGFKLGQLAEGTHALRVRLADPNANPNPSLYTILSNGGPNNSTAINVSAIGRADLLLDGDSAFESGRNYYIQVSTAQRAPTIYDLSINLTGNATVAYNLGTRFDVNQRRDVLLGGEGNDRLQGGPSEDWIFGGAGNDVMTGGLDKQAEDLLFGGPGDDLFQIVPDKLAQSPSGQTVLTTQADRFDGGAGIDQVFYQGGDFDRLSRPVPDNVAMRFSRFLQRYEVTSLVWDIANQQWQTESQQIRAIIRSAGVPKAINGILSDTATFALEVGGHSAVTVTVPKNDANLTLLDVAKDINSALAEAGLGDEVVAEVTSTGLQLASTAFGANASLKITAANSVTTNELKFVVGASAGGIVEAYEQRYASYQVLNTEGTRIETRAGDDVVHADPEYKFPLADGSNVIDSEWGIKEGNYQEGARIAALYIDGGDGNDRLFGGVLADTILGGDGADYIAGGLGDDKLDGGPGRDLIVGLSGVAPDDFEAQTRDATSQVGDETGFNDSPLFAALLPNLDITNSNGNTFSNLSFNTGDASDWYLLRAPQSKLTFNGVSSAVLLPRDISVTFDDPDDQALFDRVEWSGPNFSLFAAEQSDPNAELSYVPVEQFSGTPEYYLLHFNNVQSYGIRGAAAPKFPSSGSTQIIFTLTIGGVTSREVTFNIASTDSINDLVGKINTQFANTRSDENNANSAFLSTLAFAYLDDSTQSIVLSLKRPGELRLSAVIQSTIGDLGFVDEQSNSGVTDSMGTYKLAFASTVGDLIDVPATSGGVQLNSSYPADRATHIPLGDINGDGQGDYIIAVQDRVATFEQFENSPQSVNPHQGVGPSFARVHFGNFQDGVNGTTNFTADTNSLTLQLPAPLLSDSFGTSSSIVTGDIDNDSFDDIVVVVRSTNEEYADHSDNGIYIIWGKDEFYSTNLATPLVIDVVREADVILSGFSDVDQILIPGDIVGTGGFKDLIISQKQSNNVLLINGNVQTAAPFNSSGEFYRADFETGLNGFTINNTPVDGSNVRLAPATGLWHRSTGRRDDVPHSGDYSVYFGRSETATAGGNFNVGDSAGYLVSPTITIPKAVSNLELSFSYFLQTEDNASYDQASVVMIRNGGAPVTVASNFGTGQFLADPSNNWRHVKIDVGAVNANDTVRFEFRFDTQDFENNQNEGWFIDDVRVRGVTPATNLVEAQETRIAMPTLAGSMVSFQKAGVVDADNNGSKRDGVWIQQARPDGTPAKLFLIEGRNVFTDEDPVEDTSGLELTFATTNGILPQMLPTGDLDGDGSGDLVINVNNTQSRLIFSKTLTDNNQLIDAVITPLGDINGDGQPDMARTTSELSDRLSEDGSQLAHQVHEVYRSLGAGDRGYWSSGTVNQIFAQADFIIEPDRSRFSTTGLFAVQRGLLVAAGDLNADGKQDIALADSLGSSSHIVFGDAFTATPNLGPAALAPTEEFVTGMATPQLRDASPRFGVDLNDPALLDVTGAFRIEGNVDLERLNNSQGIGDFNNDGYDDVLVWSTTHAYVLLGPVKLDGVEPVGTRGEILIDLAGGWRPAVGAGDINGDGLGDLVFHHRAGNTSLYRVSIISGMQNPQRNYSVTDDATTLIDLTIPTQINLLDSIADIRFLKWDNDAFTDLLVAGDLPTSNPNNNVIGRIYQGSRLAGILDETPDPVATATDAEIELRYSGSFDTIANAAFRVAVLSTQAGNYTLTPTSSAFHIAIGDINGDGLDETLVSFPNEVTLTSNVGGPDYSAGSVYVYGQLGSGTGIVDLNTTEAPALIRDKGPTGLTAFSLFGSIAAIDDLNRDGKEDFAIIRGEANTASDATINIVYGRENYLPGHPSFPSSARRISQATNLSIRRFDVDALPNANSVFGPTSITSGDFDNDGRLDLAIGTTSSIVLAPGVAVDLAARGEVTVVWGAASLSGPIVLSSSDTDLNNDGRQDLRTIRGAVDNDGFGILSFTSRLDLDADGYDDLLIGASRADALSTEVVTDAGALYSIYGTPRRIALPNEAVVEVIELANRTFTGVGDVLVDPATGRPVTFEDGDLDDDQVLDTTDFKLEAGADSVRWYRFTTVGDGKAGNVLRLLPGAFDNRTTLVDGPAGYQNANGTVTDTGNLIIGGIGNKQGAFDFDLSGFLDALEDPQTLDSIKLRLFGDIAAQSISGTDEIVAGPTKVFFTGLTPETGRELFVTNGTAAGTSLVKDIVPGAFGSFVSSLTMVGDRVFFVVSLNGLPQLWTSDGTATGTVRADVFTNGSTGEFVNIHDLKTFNGKLLFVGTTNDGSNDLEQLFVADLVSGSYSISAISPQMSVNETISNLVPAGSVRLYFAVDAGAGQELWMTDGTTTATQLATFVPDGDMLLKHAATIAGDLYFAANGGSSNGKEVWRSRGTAGTTALLHDVNAAITGSAPKAFASNGSRVFFVAQGDIVYSTDGTTLSTHGDAFASGNPVGGSNAPLGTVAADGSYYALIDNGTETRLVNAAFGSSPTLSQVKSFGTDSGFTSLIPYSTSDVAFVEFNATADTSSVYRSNGTDRGTIRLLANNQQSISTVAAFGSSLLLNGIPNGATNGQSTVIASQGQPDNTLALTDIGTVSSTLRTFVVSEAGDGVITGRDFVSQATEVAMQTVSTGRSNVIEVDVTDIVRQLLGSGNRHITLRLAVDNPQVALDIAQPNPFDEVPSGLAVTRRHGVRADVLDANGGVIAENISALDMRNLEAGTYFLRVFNPHGAEQTTPLQFSIEVRPPIQGQTHVASDNDVIEGGEAEDILIGGPQLDRIYGESGTDSFIAEPVEVRDLTTGEAIRPVDTADNLLSTKPKDLDSEISFPDVVLRRAIGAALNVPLVNDQFALPVHATDLAKLTSFTFIGSNSNRISNLAGLEYATNLVSLDLSNNSIFDITNLDPSLDEAGAQVGLGLLRHLRLDGNPLRDLGTLGELIQLRVLSINDTNNANLPGLAVEVFAQQDGDFESDAFPDFALLTRVNIGVLPSVNINNDANLHHLAIRYTGQLTIESGGPYIFKLTSADGSHLYIDGQLVAQVNGLQGVPASNSSTTINLAPGRHAIKVEYYNGAGNATLKLEYQKPGDNSFTLIDNDVLSVGGLSDISQLATLQNVRYLSLANNSINDVSPIAAIHNMFTGESTLETLDLSRNDIRDLSAFAGTYLIDDGDFGFGYSESANKWFRNENELIETGYRGDYRRTFSNSFSPATWTFSGLDPNRTYEVYATWHHADGNSPQAEYVIDGNDSPHSAKVNQRFEPNSDLAINGNGNFVSPFQLLKTLKPDATGKITVQLSDLLAGGTVTADAVALRTSELPQTKLQHVNLRNNPLNEVAFDFALPALSTRASSLNPSFTLTFDANRAPSLATLPSTQVGDPGNYFEFNNLIEQEFGITDNGSDWLIVGAGDSSEVLRFNGHSDTGRGGFAEVLTQIKTTTGTQPILSGGTFGPNNDLFVVDSANGDVFKIDSANGSVLASNLASAANGRDVAFSGTSVFVTDLATKKLIRLDANDLSLVNANFATLPSTLFGTAPEYSIDVGPGSLGNDLFVAYGYSLISFNPLTFTAIGGVRRINESTGATISDIIPSSDPNLSLAVDITIDDTGKIYVVDLDPNAQTYRVLRYSSTGTFETQLIAPRSLNLNRLEVRPRIEIGPEGALYLSDPTTGNITRHSITSGSLLDNPFAASNSSNGMKYSSFLAFAQPELTYQLTTNNSNVTGFVGIGGDLQIYTPIGFSGTVEVTVGVFDGSHAAQDFRGRSTEVTFDFLVGKGEISGTVFDDQNQNGIDALAEPGLENITVFWDLDGDTRIDAGEPFARTDADGNYKLTNLTYGTHDVRVILPGNITTSVTAQSVGVSGGTPIITDVDFAAFQEINAGPDQVVDEGDPSLSVDIRRKSFTYLLQDLELRGSSGPAEFVEFNGKLYFSAYTEATGIELFVFDGTSVSLAADITGDSGDSYPIGMTVYNGQLYFGALSPSSGRELYRFDGVNEPVLIDVLSGSASSNPSDFVVFGNSLFFAANKSTDTRVIDRELFSWNGTTAALAYEVNATGNANPTELTVYNELLYFAATSATDGRELHRYNTVVAFVAADLVAGSGSSFPTDLEVFNGNLYFAATTSTQGIELIKYDGTNATVIDVNSGANGSSPYDLLATSNRLYFGATVDNVAGSEQELFYIGTDNVPVNVDVNAGTNNSSNPAGMTELNGTIYFQATVEGDTELWSYNGSAASLAVGLNPFGGSNPNSLAVYQNALIFSADDGDVGFEPFRLVDASGVTYEWEVALPEGGSIANVIGAGSPSFRFDAMNEGRYTATVTVTVPGTEISFSDTVDVYVNPVAPTIDAGPNQSDIQEGEFFVRNLTINDPGADQWLVTVDYGDGTIEVLNNGNPFTTRDFSLVHVYSTTGDHIVSVTVENDEGSSTDSFLINIESAGPVIDIRAEGDLGPSIVNGGASFASLTSLTFDEGESAAIDVLFFDGTGKIATTLDQWSFSINWGDGTTEIFNSSVALRGGTSAKATLHHIYADNNEYGVTVTVTDADGDQSTQTKTITINNVAPMINSLNVPTSLLEGQIGTFTVNFTDPGSADTHSIVWNWGDDTSNDRRESSQHAFGDDGTYTVTVTVTDDDGESVSQTFDIEVTNANPTFFPAADQTIDEGSELAIELGEFRDAGFKNTETFTYEINWGDGSAIETGLAPRTFNDSRTAFAFGFLNGTHTYADNGVYLVTITIFDDNGGTTDGELLPNNGGSGLIAGTGDSNSFLVTVVGVAPSISTISDQAAAEGAPFNITDIATFTDPGFTDPANQSAEEFTYSINWGDGTTDEGTARIDQKGGFNVLTQGSFNGSHQYADSGKYEVSITVTDDDGDASTSSFKITINNLAPTLTLDPTVSQVAVGENFTFSGSFSDIAADVVEVLVDVGDGLQRQAVITDNTFQFGHVFSTPGQKTITVTAIDDDGGSTSQVINLNSMQPDVRLLSFTGTGNTATFQYEIVGASPDSLEIRVYRSLDTVFDSTSSMTPDELLDVIVLTDAADLTPGTHTKTVTIGAASNDLSLPGVGRAEDGNDYFLLGVADPRDLIDETDATPFAEDNTASFAGAYHAPVAPATTAPVYIHSGTISDTLTAQPDGTSLMLNGTLHNLGATVSSVRVRSHAGNDNINLSTLALPSFVFAGVDNDTVFGGSANDTLIGDAGNDSLMGGAGVDQLNGGAGVDTLKEVANANFVLTNLTLTLVASGTTTQVIDILQGFELADLTGGNSRNVIDLSGFTASLGATVMSGNGGDVVIGSPGPDLIIAGTGADSISGGAGNDSVFAGNGNDTIHGGDGADNLTGQNNADVINGDAGVDVLVGGAGIDTLNGGADNDFLSGQADAGLLIGGTGNDILQGSTANDTLQGDDGNDKLFGMQGNDSLVGGEGSDSLLGDADNDTLSGGNGNDTLLGGFGNDLVDGGADFDIVREIGDTDFSVVGTNVISVLMGSDTDINIERINLQGGPSANHFNASAAVVQVFLFGEGGNDSLRGGSRNDALFGADGDDILAGGGGNDTLSGDNGNDTINGGSGNDALDGGNGNDGLSGYTGNDSLIGGMGNDTLFGHDGNDTLLGGLGNDALIGDGGTSVSGPGSDSINGESGSDQIRVDAGDTIITDVDDSLIPGLFTTFPSWVDQI